MSGDAATSLRRLLEPTAERGGLVEVAVAGRDPVLRLLLVDFGAVELDIPERQPDVAGECVAPRAEGLEVVLGVRVCQVVRAAAGERAGRGAERIRREGAERRVDLLV